MFSIRKVKLTLDKILCKIQHSYLSYFFFEYNPDLSEVLIEMIFESLLKRHLIMYRQHFRNTIFIFLKVEVNHKKYTILKD